MYATLPRRGNGGNWPSKPPRLTCRMSRRWMMMHCRRSLSRRRHWGCHPCAPCCLPKWRRARMRRFMAVRLRSKRTLRPRCGWCWPRAQLSFRLGNRTRRPMNRRAHPNRGTILRIVTNKTPIRRWRICWSKPPLRRSPQTFWRSLPRGRRRAAQAVQAAGKGANRACAASHWARVPVCRAAERGWR